MAKYHICLLEEDPFLAGLYGRKFEERGWRVEVAEDIDDLEACLEASPIDVLVMDVQGASYDALPYIREARRSMGPLQTMPIVVLSSVQDRKVLNDLMRLEVDAVLLKGHFVPKEAVEKVAAILDR